MNPQDTPAPVEVTNSDPMPVSMVEHKDTTAQEVARKTAASARVDADVLRTEDQRRISQDAYGLVQVTAHQPGGCLDGAPPDRACYCAPREE